MDKSSNLRRQRHQQPLQMKTREQVTGLQKTASVRLAGGPRGPGEGGGIGSVRDRVHWSFKPNALSATFRPGFFSCRGCIGVQEACAALRNEAPYKPDSHEYP